MKYVVEIEINKPQAEVAWGYVNLEKMYAWEKGLKRIEHQKGKLFDTGSIGHLVFEFNGVEMPMKVTVEKEKLPDHIIQIFEVPGAWNRCDSHFIAQGSMTKWVMDVEFRLDKPTDIPQERFVEKTTQSMHVYKDYIEKD
ncbi:MAG: SRPBCC family protein [Acholeplasmataceae bacterium]|jgi:hypothetical protein|nr:SRPBCC family protein [Acholeplasmataceae bacterium]